MLYLLTISHLTYFTRMNIGSAQYSPAECAVLVDSSRCFLEAPATVTKDFFSLEEIRSNILKHYFVLSLLVLHNPFQEVITPLFCYVISYWTISYLHAFPPLLIALILQQVAMGFGIVALAALGLNTSLSQSDHSVEITH